MKNKEDTEMGIASKSCYTKLNTSGHHPMLHVLDNECSCAANEYITLENTDLQFIESYNHKVNTVKHSYKAAKYHTIVTLCTIDLTFPIQVGEKSMLQIETALNIIQTS